MFGWFSKKVGIDIRVDIHSHLLPNLDDGVRDFDESLEIIRGFSRLGFKKLITTPHIYSDHYPNTHDTILKALRELKKLLKQEKLSIEVEAAAEYYIDAHLIDLLDRKAPILSFGTPRYVLVETGFHTKPIIFDEVIFKLKSLNYVPVLAHPERYMYLEDDLSWLRQIREKGVRLQVSVPSLYGFYGTNPKKMAMKLLKETMVDFFGSDLHRKSQMEGFEKSLGIKISPQNVLNNELI